MTTLTERVQSLRSNLRYNGVVATLWKLTQKVVAPAVEINIQILFEKDLTTPIESRAANVPLTIRQADQTEISRLIDAQNEAPPKGIDRDYMIKRTMLSHLLRDRLRRGEKCYIAEADGEIAHVNWTCFRWGEVAPGLPIVPEPGEIYTTDGYTSPRWRGKHIHEAVLNQMLQDAQRQGYRCAFTVADYDNKRPHHGLLRLGWKIRGTLFYAVPRRLGRVFAWRLSGDVQPIFRSRNLSRESLEALLR